MKQFMKLVDYVKVDSPPQRWLYLAGALLVASGLFHCVVWQFDGGTWEGSVSWRKPILFGISTGLTVLSLGWIYPKLKPRSNDRWALPIFSLAMVVEVTLITIQQWRGVASHFNRSTTFDSFADSAVTWLIVFASLVIADLALRCFQFLRGKSDIKLAIRSGMAFLIISLVLGYVALIYGQQASIRGQDPETFGSAGVMKFPHGVAIHAIQLLPMLAWALQRIGFSQQDRYRSILSASIAMSLLLLLSLVQTFSGRSRFDFDWLGYSLLSLAILVTLPVAKRVLLALFSTSKSSASTV